MSWAEKEQIWRDLVAARRRGLLDGLKGPEEFPVVARQDIEDTPATRYWRAGVSTDVCPTICLFSTRPMAQMYEDLHRAVWPHGLTEEEIYEQTLDEALVDARDAGAKSLVLVRSGVPNVCVSVGAPYEKEGGKP